MLVELGAQLPVYGVERVARAVFADVMLLREAAARLGAQPFARRFAVGQFGEGDRAHRLRQQQDVAVGRPRQTAEKQAGQVVHPHPAVSVPQNAHMREIRLQRERGFHAAVDRQLPLRRRTAEGGIDGGVFHLHPRQREGRGGPDVQQRRRTVPRDAPAFQHRLKDPRRMHRPQADQQGKQREQENNRQREQRQIACIHAVKHERQQQRYAVSEPSFDHTRRLSALDGRICQRIAGRGAVRRMLVSTS